MEIEQIKNKGQGRLFEHDYMELMTKTHPIVIYSMYLPVAAFMLYYGFAYKGLTLVKELLLLAAGVFFWTFFEYMMHRFVFHFVSERPRLKKIIYTMHGVHHEYPRDKERLFMPPVPSILAATVIFSSSYLLIGWNALAFFPGFLIGYLVYGSMHYAIHAFTPPPKLKALWRNHHLHHYKYPQMGFGVSSVIWDVIFRTVPPKK